MKAQQGPLWESSQSGCSGASQLQILWKISPLSHLPYGQTNQYGVSDDKWSQVLKCHGFYLRLHESLFLKLNCPITNKITWLVTCGVSPNGPAKIPHIHGSQSASQKFQPQASIIPSLHLSWCTEATCPCPNPLFQDPWVAREFGGRCCY